MQFRRRIVISTLVFPFKNYISAHSPPGPAPAQRYFSFSTTSTFVARFYAGAGTKDSRKSRPLWVPAAHTLLGSDKSPTHTDACDLRPFKVRSQRRAGGQAPGSSLLSLSLHTWSHDDCPSVLNLLKAYSSCLRRIFFTTSWMSVSQPSVQSRSTRATSTSHPP